MQNADGEQPTLEPADVSNETIEKSVASEGGSQEEGKFGKFRTAEALFDAYKSLEAEFTRKSQRLSELEKDIEEKATVDKQSVESDLSSFLSEHSEALPYAEKLKSLAAEGETNFDSMLAKIILEDLKSGASKMENPIIKKYVFQDEELKNHVIENYMKQLRSGEAPKVISGDNGQKVAGVKPATPQSLKEAKKMVEDLFS